MGNTNNVEETESDKDKDVEEHARETEYLDKLQIANTGDFCRAIRYFSGFAIPLILTITDISLSKNWAIWVTAGIFLFAILSSIIGHFLSDFGIEKRRDYIELYWRRDQHEYRFKQHWSAQWGRYSDNISLVSFLTGTVLFIWFIANGLLIIKGA